MRLRYAVTGMTRGRAITGQAELTWQHADRRYEIRLEQDIDHQPRRSQRSAGLITPQGLAPQRFSERARHEEAVHLGQDNGRIVFSANRPEVTLLPGAQDRLSLLLQLGARIAASPQAYPAGTWIEMQGVTTREARIWRFRVGNVEELQLPGGHQSTLHLVRAPTGDFEPTLEVWLAPAQDYAPVRIRLTQATGDWQDQQWAGTDRR